MKQLSASAHIADRLRGLTNNEMEIRDAARDDRAHPDHTEAADDDAASNRAIRADRRTLTHESCKRRFIGLRRQQRR